MMAGLAAEHGETKTVMLPLGTSLSRCPAGQRTPPTSRPTERRPVWA
jgi:hypothetical protein